MHHRCIDCQHSFIATSRDEAEEESEKLRESNPDYADYGFEEMTDENIVAYAKYCPYCTSTNIGAV